MAELEWVVISVTFKSEYVTQSVLTSLLSNEKFIVVTEALFAIDHNDTYDVQWSM